MSAPRVVVLGGCGFLGRHLVEYLVKNKLASKIKVADKTPPQLAGMSSATVEMYKSENVVFQQANLARESMVKKVFEDGPYQIVFNVAGNSNYGQTPEVYKENVVDIAKTCGKIAEQNPDTVFVQVSTAQVYDSEKKTKN